MKERKEIVNFIKLKVRSLMPYPVGYQMEKTKVIALEMAEKLKELFPIDSLPMNGGDKPQLILCVRGSSGAILAGMMTIYLAEYDVVTNYISKTGENRHGSDDLFLPRNYPWIILDDFIQSGETINKIFLKMLEDSGIWKVDCLCVSGTVKQINLKFEPQHVIAGNYLP